METVRVMHPAITTPAGHCDASHWLQLWQSAAQPQRERQLKVARPHRRHARHGKGTQPRSCVQPGRGVHPRLLLERRLLPHNLQEPRDEYTLRKVVLSDWRAGKERRQVGIEDGSTRRPKLQLCKGSAEASIVGER